MVPVPRPRHLGTGSELPPPVDTKMGFSWNTTVLVMCEFGDLVGFIVQQTFGGYREWVGYMSAHPYKASTKYG